MDTNEPNYNDVSDFKRGFREWCRTYEYRGIKYNIMMLHRSPSRWFVVEPHEASRSIVRLVGRIDIRHDFIYHVCDQHESLKSMFYDAADRAKKDIDWFLDNALNDLDERMKQDRAMYSETVYEIMKLRQTMTTVLGHDINEIWDESDSPEGFE